MAPVIDYVTGEYSRGSIATALMRTRRNARRLDRRRHRARVIKLPTNAIGLDACCARCRRILIPSLGPLPARAVRVPPDVAHQVLVAIRDVAQQQLQPLGAGHHLEIPLQAQVHLRAVNDRPRLGVVAHLLKRHWCAQHIACELLSAFGVLCRDPHLIVHREAAVADVKNTLRNHTFVTVENGHHSYGAASLNQMTFDFFERVLDRTPARNITSARFSPGRATATVTATGGGTSTVALGRMPVNQNGTLTVALDDLAKIYGTADFKIYDIHAYNRTPSDLVTVKTITYNKVAINIKVGERFLRTGGAIHAGDTTGLTTKVPVGDPAIDPRMLSVAANNLNGQIHVPVVEFMQLFGKTVVVE